MRTRLLLLLAGIAAGPLVVSVASADDSHRLDDLKFDASRTSLTAESASADSDGDGWVDWYERFEGTDPNDAKSYPGSAQLEIVDGRVVLQSANFPDRFVIVDLATPEVLSKPESAISTLVGLVQNLGKGTSTGSALQSMIQQLGKYGGVLPDVNGLIAQTPKEAGGSSVLGPRVGGIPMGLISSLTVGLNDEGNMYFVLSYTSEAPDASFSVSVRYDPITGTDKFLERGLLLFPADDGYSTIEWCSYDGTEIYRVRKVIDGEGKVVSTQYFDPNGKPYGPPTTTPPATPVTAAPVTATPVTTKTTETSVTTPVSVTTPTTAGDYADPDYQRPQRLSDKEIAERVEFLKGLTGRFGSTIELPSGPTEKPGVSDPAEPECKGVFCVLFTVVEAPDLSNVNGGDRINPSFGPEAPPVTIR